MAKVVAVAKKKATPEVPVSIPEECKRLVNLKQVSSSSSMGVATSDDKGSNKVSAVALVNLSSRTATNITLHKMTDSLAATSHEALLALDENLSRRNGCCLLMKPAGLSSHLQRGYSRLVSMKVAPGMQRKVEFTGAMGQKKKAELAVMKVAVSMHRKEESVGAIEAGQLAAMKDVQAMRNKEASVNMEAS